ncbi:protein transport protein Sec24D-like [Ostrinia furnacalis]|uniref:protein transport protein Sec24D-like n=1 Tax=Ostrinia furnacalis TaxID=93504 RepID=UPI00103B9D75|nr:protein transport protein Sec24D-like [Ostrinia furnacalis]
MLLWVGSAASPEFVRDVFGAASPQHIDTQVAELPELDNPTSQAARALVEEARVKRRNAMRLDIVHQYDKREAMFRRLLVEDRGLDGADSYTEHLLNTHKTVQKML